MKNALITALLLTTTPVFAAHKSPAVYDHSFHVHRAMDFNGCIMNVREGNIDYALVGGRVCFTVGQTLQGRLLNNQIEVVYTDNKGKLRTAKYQIAGEKEE
jgi:hypothetical protein